MPVRAQTLQEHDVIVEGVVKIVQGNLAASHELGWIASELGYSERHLRRILVEKDIHWRLWLAEQRMQRAATMLATGRYVQQVARKVGYKPDHFAAPFAAYAGVLPSEARRAGQLQVQLHTLSLHPPRSADVAANCRVIDRWTRLHREAISLRLRTRAGTPVAAALQIAVSCAPPRRPHRAPRGRYRRQLVLADALRTTVVSR
jgi:AraC-like DNA-binding protein